MQIRDVLIGIDGGGTHSRAMCATIDGNVLAAAEGAPTNPDYNSGALKNFRDLVSDVLSKAGRDAAHIAGLAAGLAGVDDPNDDEWALEMTSVPGMTAKPVWVNDSVVAQMGAFALNPGIVVVLSTGAITVGITESGEKVCNYDFNQYARASARFLSHDAVYRLLTEEIESADKQFLGSVLNYWGVGSLAGLRDIAKRYTVSEKEASIRRYGLMAPLITQAASAGSPLAKRVCDFAAAGTAQGVRLVASCFEADDISIALHGSLALCPYMKAAVCAALAAPSAKRYHLVEALLPPTAGAILLAAREAGGLCLDTIRENLLKIQRQPS
jgi:glucosamine kinase